MVVFPLGRLMTCARISVFAIAMMLCGCVEPDPTLIIGRWRAETFKLESVKLPIAPNFEITRNELILKSPDNVPFKKLPLSAIRAQGQTIELEFQNGFGIGLEFVIETRDRIHIKIPFTPIDIAFDRS